MGLWDSLRHIVRGHSGARTEADLDKVQDIIGYHFRDDVLLLLSLTHRSWSYAQDDYQHCNERLEFLGDSVLGLVIAERLYQDHPDLREGELTKAKALLVSETTLAQICIETGLNSHLLLAPEEDRSGGRERPSIVSDALESIIGAVFLDAGFEAARDVVLRLIYSHKDEIVTDDSRQNFKGELLELSQARGEGMPQYTVESETGPDHDKVFTITVTINGTAVGTGTGHSKKEAEQQAASEALEQLHKSS